MNRTYHAKGDPARWLVIVLTLFAFGRSVWALGEKSLWWDESLSLHRARQDLVTVLSNTIVLTDNVESVVTVDDHPPLYFLALWLAVRAFGETDLALRYVSVIFGVLIVPLLYSTARRLFGQRLRQQRTSSPAVAAAALGALSPMFLWFGQEARMYTMLACMGLLSFYLFMRAFVEPLDSPELRVRWEWIGSYVLASSCLVLTHYLGSLVIAFEILALGLLLLRDLRSRRSLVLGIVVLVGVLLLLFAYSLLNLPQLTNTTGARFVPVLVLLRDLLNSFSLGLSADVGHWYVWLIDLVFLFFLGLGLVRMVGPGATGRSRRVGWLLAGYLVVPIALTYLFSYVRPVYMTSRHLILGTPPFLLLVALGLAAGTGERPGIGLRGVIIPVVWVGWLVALGGIAYSTWNYYRDPAYGKDDYRAWGAYLQEHTRPGDIVIVDPPHVADLYRHYTDNGVPWIGLPQLNSPKQATVSRLEGLFERYDRVWLAYSSTPSWGDPGRLPYGWLSSRAYQVDYQRFQGYGSELLVAAYLPDWPSVRILPPDAQPADIRYSTSVRLVGHRLVSTPQAGRHLHVELFWTADKPIPEEASVLLRLVDDQGHLWGQSEQCPFNGLYPMWQWQPGLLLRDERDLPIWPGTPPGTYHLELVLLGQGETCPGSGNQPLPPVTALNRRGNGVLLGDVIVERAQTSPSLEDLGMQRRQGQGFDDLELLGSSLTARQLRAGEHFDVSLYWQARQAPLPDYLFRLRLVDATGTVWHESTIRPVGDGYPTSLWRAGDRFRGTFRLWLPEDAASGRYRLELTPEPPLQQRGLGAFLRRVLNLGSTGVQLGSLAVTEPQSVTLATPPPPPADPPASHSMLATLGEQVRFLGYDLSTDKVLAGEALTVTLYWQALQPMDISYTVFLHLLGPENQIVGQKDGLPQNGTYPTSAWQPGEVVVDQRTFTVDPSAPLVTHTLEAGMYRLETLRRLPVIDASGQPMPDDRILLAQIELLPAEAHAPTRIDLPLRVFLPLVVDGR